ncbi:MAG: LemA family protein [Dehalococcoidia bacterium]|nr:LemA family protein [Dehalococcoidia bacterium]
MLKARTGCLIGIGVVILIILITGGIFWGNYNSLVTKSQSIDAQWAQVEAQYQRRYDLIPNLVNSVKGIMAQEQAVFSQIAEARTKYAGAKTTDEKAVASSNMDSALSRLLVIMENYPQLRSVETITQLMDELSGTENRISVERRRYNTVVQEYNTSIKKVPTNLIASMFNFNEKEYFKSVSGADQVPKVDFK